MSKILIVPDVHGRKFWHKAIEMIDGVDQVVFLGDYLDPYPHEGITFEDALIEFGGILAFKEDYPDKVVLLIGNHCAHYWDLQFMNCSRLNVQRRAEVHDLFINNIDKFQLIHEIDNYLFSHAGVYTSWLKSNDLKLDDLQDFKTFLANHFYTLEDLSFYRGGWNSVGSCVWADIRESVGNELPIMFKKQIVGHTQMESKPYITSKIACLDVRQCFILDTETDEIMGIDA